MKTSMKYTSPKNISSGISLVEVLIAIVILSLGLLGIAGLQSAALSNNSVSLQNTQAVIFAENLAERMRGNSDGVKNNLYLLNAGTAPGTPPKNCGNAACSSIEMAAWDLASIYAAVSGTTVSNVTLPASNPLPGGRVSISCSETPCVESSPRLITVYWDAARRGVTGLNCNPNNANDLRCYRLGYIHLKDRI
jgi:type IV pilus assembly protein PilV